MNSDDETLLRIVERRLDENAGRIAGLLLSTDKQLTVPQMEEMLANTNQPLEQKEIRKALYAMADERYAKSRRLRDVETGIIEFYWEIKPENIRL